MADSIVHGYNGPGPRMAPGTRVQYRPNHKSFGAFMLSDQIRDPVAEVAQQVQHQARRNAPRRKSGVTPDGLAMADRFRVNVNAGVISIGEGGPRVKVEVYNEARSAAPNEFGSERNKRHRMLGRAGAAFGDFKGTL